MKETNFNENKSFLKPIEIDGKIYYFPYKRIKFKIKKKGG